MTDAEQFAQFADSAFTAFGDVALVVNNAGLGSNAGAWWIPRSRDAARDGSELSGRVARLSAIREAAD